MMMKRARTEFGTGVVEALIAITLLSLVMAAMVGVLLQQQRFYMVTGDAANTSGTLQRLEAAVVTELLPLSPGGGDVVYADPDSVVLRAFRGVYAVCEKKLTTDVFITVRPLSDGVPLRTDSILVFSHGTQASFSDDHWKAVRITSIKKDVCPDSSAAWTATIPDLNGLLSQVPIGAPVRVFQRASYWLTPENNWWVLKTTALSGQPSLVGGPLASTDSTAASVLQFRYLDLNGNPTATLAEIARVEVDVSAVGAVPRQRGGVPLRRDRTVSIRLRNADS